MISAELFLGAKASREKNSIPGSRSDEQLGRLMGFQFAPLIHRMVDKHGWREKDAKACFEDLKRFFYLSSVSERSIIPSKKIDEMWHNWILFTKDYAMFCQSYFGRFIHHKPRLRSDPPVGSGCSIKETLQLARQTFGQLSENWSFPNKAINEAASCSCSSWCQCS